MADDDPEILAALEAEYQRDLFRALTHLLDRGARPPVVVIDDIHWADQAMAVGSWTEPDPFFIC